MTEIWQFRVARVTLIALAVVALVEVLR